VSDKTKKVEPAKPVEKVVIPWAYTLYEDPERPGLYFALELSNVVAEKVRHCEPSGRSSHSAIQLGRMLREIDKRQTQRAWGGKK